MIRKVAGTLKIYKDRPDWTTDIDMFSRAIKLAESRVNSIGDLEIKLELIEESGGIADEEENWQ